MYNKDDIENKVKQILSKQLNKDINKITKNSLLKEDLGMDSFSILEIQFDLKEEFNKKISEEDFFDIKNVNDLIEYFSV